MISNASAITLKYYTEIKAAMRDNRCAENIPPFRTHAHKARNGVSSVGSLKQALIKQQTLSCRWTVTICSLSHILTPQHLFFARPDIKPNNLTCPSRRHMSFLSQTFQHLNLSMESPSVLLHQTSSRTFKLVDSRIFFLCQPWHHSC